MICKNCGFEIPENDRFCSNCGVEVTAQARVNEAQVNEPQENMYGGYAQGDMYGNGQNAYYGNQNVGGGFYAGNPQGYWAPPVNDKAPEIKDYLKWMLVYPLLNLIPGVGFILYIAFCIKYAIDNTYKARANYFKAVLVAQLIGLAIAVLICIFMFGFLTFFVDSVVTGIQDFDPSFFMNEFYDEIYDVLSVALFR